MKKLHLISTKLRKEFVTGQCYDVVFGLLILASLLIWAIASLLFGMPVFTSVFFRDTEDLFMDFFNSVRDASLVEGAYTVRHVIYPPMANLFFWLMSFLTPDAYNATSFEERYSWTKYSETTLPPVILFVILGALAIGFAAYFGLRESKKRRLFFAAMFTLSSPILYLLERGNMLIFSLAFLLIYVATYYSPRPVIREIGLICLAFSFSLKLYPLVFAWLLIGDKRYKDFARCVLYCLLLLILPSFAFGGPTILLTILQNIFSFSVGDGKGVGVFWIVGDILHVPSALIQAIFYIWFFLCAVNFAIAPFVHKERWKIWLCGCVAFLAFPSLTSNYAWALFLIPMIFLCEDKTCGKKAMGYFILMTISFLHFCIPTPVPVTFSTILVYFMMFILSGYTLVDTLQTILSQQRKKHALCK